MKAPDIRYVGTRHEGNAAIMAAAVYAGSGSLRRRIG